MRLHLQLSPNREPVPFNYQHALTGAFHKWLGQDNELHDRISLYSFGWLDGGRMTNNHLAFPRGAQWRISFHDETLIEDFVNRALREPEVCYGMRLTAISQQATPHFGSRYHFKVGSPVLARAPDADGRIKHLIYSDPEADDVLTATLHRKMDAAGLDAQHKTTRVCFDRAYRGAKTKLVRVKEISSRASVCPVIVEGTPDAVAFAWTVGVGHSTGSGFGSLI